MAATTEKKTGPAHVNPPNANASEPEKDPNAFDMSALEGLTQFASRLPQYDPGADARTSPIGTKGAPIHGYMLTTLDLPSTIKDKDGTLRPWTGVVIELKQPCPVKEGDSRNPKRRMAQPGERIILTESTAFSRFSKVADHQHLVYECFILPEVSKTKSNNQSLWIYPDVRLGKPIRRTEQHLVGVADLLEEPEVHPALPMHSS